MEVLRGNGLGLIQCGGGECIVGGAIDFSGQPMGGLEQGLDNGVFEQGELAAGEAQTVFEVLGKLLALETGEVETHDDALVEWLVDGHGEAASELGESDEEEAQTVFGLDVVQRQQSEVFEDVVSQVMGLVEPEQGALFELDTQSGDFGADNMVGVGAVVDGG